MFLQVVCPCCQSTVLKHCCCCCAAADDDDDDVYCLLFAVKHAPFMCQVLRPTVGPVHETAGTGKLINAALLSLFLMRRV